MFFFNFLLVCVYCTHSFFLLNFFSRFRLSFEKLFIQVKWFLNGEVVNTRERGRYIGGTVDQPSLTILSASKADKGTYSCILGEILTVKLWLLKSENIFHPKYSLSIVFGNYARSQNDEKNTVAVLYK